MKFKFGKETFDFDVESDETVLTIKTKLQELIGFDTIKLIHAGKVLSDDNVPIISIPGGNAAKLTVMGTNSTVIASVSNQMSQTTRVIDDLNDNLHNTTTQYKSSSHTAVKHMKQSQYRFNNIETLSELPNREKAVDILTQLANDPGVLAVMEKHKWTVGTLCELYPEGHVGVSDVCVMGLNENHGQRILLRLRTDDLKGFRNILSIKKVLYHELAHNVHSEHDDQFYILMRQIEREVALLDWRQSKGHTTGYESRNSNHSNTLHDRGDANYYNGMQSSSGGGDMHTQQVYRLGGSTPGDELLQQMLPARYLAGSAAIMRLSVEEKEVEDNCGSGGRRGSEVCGIMSSSHANEHHPTISNAVIPPLSSVVEVVVSEMNETVIEEAGTTNILSAIGEQQNDLQQQPQPQSSNSNEVKMDVVQDVSVIDVDVEERTVDNTVLLTPIVPGNDNNYSSVSVVTPEAMSVAEIPSVQSQVEIENSISLHHSAVQANVLSGIDDSIAFALSLESSAAPVDKLFQLRAAIELLLKSEVCREMVRAVCNTVGNGENRTIMQETVFHKCMKLLLKIITNAKDHLNSTSVESMKYKSIKTTTNTYQRYIATIPSAADILYAAGFSADSTGEQLRLSRQDPGLLYMVHSMLSGAVEKIEEYQW